MSATIQTFWKFIGEFNFKIMSPLIGRGIRNLHKRKSIFTWIEKQKSDITFLQETYSTPEIINDWKFQWRGEMIFSHGSNHSRGVLVLINEQLQYEINNIVLDDEGRYILMAMTIQESPFLLLNLYAPTKLNEQKVIFKKFYLLFRVLILIQNVGSSLAEISMFI